MIRVPELPRKGAFGEFCNYVAEHTSIHKYESQEIQLHWKEGKSWLTQVLTTK